LSRNFDILHREIAQPSGLRPAAVPHMPRNGGARTQDCELGVENEVVKLVQRVFVLPGAVQAPEVVAFCGIEEGAGCSWVCARTSEVLAEQVPGKVCVIDANLRKPSLHEHFRAERSGGLADAMKDSRPVTEYTKATWISKLWVMTSGTVVSDPNGVLNPAKLRTRFAELRADFDYLLVDTPPMGSYADATLLSQLTDGVILVLDSSSTRREPARIAKEGLEAARISVLGAVLNRRTYPIPETLYRWL
jgi:capsular exopolysaccharide synthesis family protein